jgi:hypothetical protein
MSTEQNKAMTDAEAMEQDGLVPTTEATYEAIEAIYVEAQDAQKTPLPQDQLDTCINVLEALAGALPEQRTLYTTDDSEVILEQTATCLAWEDAVHVKTIKALLGDPKEGTKRLDKWTCVTESHGLVSRWTAESGEKMLVYAAGEGGRVEGWHMENKSQEVETMSAHIERPEVLKVLSRKLGVLPKDEEKRMTVLRAQQSSIIQALSFAMGETEEVWEEYKYPKLMASLTGKATNAAQSAQYTLKRKTEHKSEIHLKELSVKKLDEHQRKPGGTGRGALDRDKLLLATGKPGGGIGRALLSFEEATGSRPSIAIMGMHLCAGDKLVRNHEEGVACVKAMRRTARLLPPGLRAKRAGEKLCERLVLREEEQCPLFTVWSVKLGKLAPCEAGRGCRGSIGSCRQGRWVERGTHLPQDVLALKAEWEAEEKEAAEERMQEVMLQERAVSKAYVTAKRTAEEAALTSPPGLRRSPRRDGKGGGGKGGEARGGGGKGVGGKGGGGKGNGQPFQLGSNGGRGAAEPSAKPPFRFGTGGGRGAAASSATATLSSQEAAERPAAATSAAAPIASGAEGAAASSAAGAPIASGAEGEAASSAAATIASGIPVGGNVTSEEATGEAAAPAVENATMEEATGGAAAPVADTLSEEDLKKIAQLENEENPSSPTPSQLAEWAMEASGVKSVEAGPSSGSARGRRKTTPSAPTPIPMASGGVARNTRKNSPRDKPY